MQQPQPIVNSEDFEAQSKRGLNVQPLLRTLRRKFLIVASIMTAMTGFASFKLAGEPPSYGTSFRILVEPVANESRITDPLSLTRAEGGVPTGVFGLDYPTQLQILQSPEILDDVVEEVKKEYPDFSLGALSQGLYVARIGTNRLDQTKIIEVSYGGGDPELVQLVLNEVAERFLRYSLEDRKSRFSQGINFIEDQLPELQERVSSLQNQLQFLQQRYEVIDPALQGDQISQRFEEATILQTETQRQLREQQALYDTLQQQLQLSPDTAIAASTLSQDPGYQTLLASLQEIESEIAAESVRFSENSPVIQALRKEQDNLYTLLDRQAERVLGQDLPSGGGAPEVLGYQNSIRLDLINQLVAAANQIEILQERNRSAAQERISAEQRLQQFPAISRQYNDLQRQLDIATRTLDQLLSQRENLRVESAQTDVPWELISEPMLPADAEGNPIPAPQDKKGLLIAFAASFILGAGLAVLLERLQNIFFSTEDIEDLQDVIQIPLLGTVPYFDKAQYFPESPSLALVPQENPNSRFSSFSEAFTSLYARLCLVSEVGGSQSIAICSTSPGDGKTTIASNLAYAVAGMGKRVLLVDANLRDPQIQNRFDVLNPKGLADLLVNDTLELNEVVQQSSQTPTLFIITAGLPTPGATRLLASTRMQALMTTFKATYDLVVYDTPHFLGIADSNFIASQIDTVLMAIGVSRTSRSDTLQVLEELKGFHPHGLGLVANHPKNQFGGSFGYHNPKFEMSHWKRVKMPDSRIPSLEENIQS